MCGRFALAYVRGFLTRFDVIDYKAQLSPRFNIAPTQMAPIVIRESPNRLEMMRWGFIPFWAKDPKIGNKMINARVETVATKPAFRTSLKRRRCLVPATGFYEWRKSGKTKTPFYVHVKDDSMFAFAGLYDRWTNPSGGSVASFTIITGPPNSVMEKIHDRMPAMLRREHEDIWLRQGPLADEELREVLRPFPANRMAAYQVSRSVNNPENDSEDLISAV